MKKKYLVLKEKGDPCNTQCANEFKTIGKAFKFVSQNIGKGEVYIIEEYNVFQHKHNEFVVDYKIEKSIGAY